MGPHSTGFLGLRVEGLGLRDFFCSGILGGFSLASLTVLTVLWDAGDLEFQGLRLSLSRVACKEGFLGGLGFGRLR